MPRNQEAHFAVNPSVNIQRSRMEIPFGHTFDFNVGELIPFMWMEVLPGDSISMDTSKVVRMTTLLDPVMGTMYLDTYYFFVPMRLVWSHTREFFGENTQGAWYPETTYTIPQIKTTSASKFGLHSVADYMGLPVGVSNLEVSALPLRSYGLVYDEWFRDTNLQAPLDLYKGDTTQTANANSGYLGGSPYIACKLHDYFSSALPSPQRGPAVQLPLTGTIPINLGGNEAPVVASATLHSMARPVRFGNQTLGATGSGLALANLADSDGIREARFIDGSSSVGNFHMANLSNLVTTLPSNATANLDGASPITVNDLRMAFATQKWYELSARFGGRYIEYLKAHFSVNAGDYRLQRSEYLGGNRIPINVQQVEATVSTSEQPLAHLGAYSHTSDYNSDGTWSFVEHGFLLGLCVARYPHVYCQGIHQSWSRKSVFQYYDPLFANLGEMPILEKEIYATGEQGDDDVFGYQEAWASYRYMPDRVSGCMRPGVQGSLASWNYADIYSEAPRLSASWIKEDKNMVDRSLAVSSSQARQLIADIRCQMVCVRPMPVYSIPGLIDHH